MDTVWPQMLNSQAAKMTTLLTILPDANRLVVNLKNATSKLALEFFEFWLSLNTALVAAQYDLTSLILSRSNVAEDLLDRILGCLESILLPSATEGTLLSLDSLPGPYRFLSLLYLSPRDVRVETNFRMSSENMTGHKQEIMRWSNELHSLVDDVDPKQSSITISSAPLLTRVASFARFAHAVLSKHHNIPCDKQHLHTTHIMLSTYSNLRNNSEDCHLDLILSVNHDQVFWEEVRVHGLNPRTEPESMIRFNLVSSENSDWVDSSPNQLQTICQELGDQATAKILRHNWVVQHNHDLWNHLRSDRQYAANGAYRLVSYTEYLARQPVNSFAKLFLAVILAYSLCYLSPGPWIPAHWPRHDIKFIQAGGQIFLRPLLYSSALSHANSKQIEGSPTGLRYPVLVGFAIMLLELHQGCSFRDMLVQDRDPQNLKMELVLAQWAFKQRQTNISEPQYRQVIADCLNTNFGLSTTATADDFQYQVYLKIVTPLFEQLQRSFGDFLSMDDLDAQASEMDLHTGLQGTRAQITQQEFRRAPSRYVTCDEAEPQPRAMREVTVTDNQADSASGAYSADCLMGEEDYVAASGVLSNRTDKWFEELQNVYRFRNCDINCPTRLKIAILDTGLDENHWFLRGANKQRVKAVSSWLHDGQEVEWNWGDKAGHGTHIACTIMTNVTNADIYIARVTDTRKLTDRHTLSVSRALRKAREEWKVDLINLSFGFKKGNSYIDQEIQNTLKDGILIFVAASNAGGNQQRSYPAVRPQGIFCVHSTDHLGNGSRYNPTPVVSDDNFSCLGELIDSAWPSDVAAGLDDAQVSETGMRRMSGTSFATPVALIIAAIFIDMFPDMCSDNHAERSTILNLKTYTGMIQVFRIFAEPRTGYSYLNPQQFLSQNREQVEQQVRNKLDLRRF